MNGPDSRVSRPTRMRPGAAMRQHAHERRAEPGDGRRHRAAAHPPRRARHRCRTVSSLFTSARRALSAPRGSPSILGAIGRPWAGRPAPRRAASPLSIPEPLSPCASEPYRFLHLDRRRLRALDVDVRRRIRCARAAESVPARARRGRRTPPDWSAPPAPTPARARRYPRVAGVMRRLSSGRHIARNHRTAVSRFSTSVARISTVTVAVCGVTRRTSSSATPTVTRSTTAWWPA